MGVVKFNTLTLNIKDIAMIYTNKILLIEDNTIVIKITNRILNELGFYNIKIAENGNDALKLIDESYSLILLDIGLPDMNGFDLCCMLRKNNKYKDMPIIAHTTQTEDIEEKCKLAGVNDILIKPVSQVIFADKLSKWLDKKYIKVN